MADIYTAKKRSEIMSLIKSKNTKPELKMAGIFEQHGIAFEQHVQMIGKPDFALVDMGILFFVDGEFWHGHTMTPKKRETLTDFWVKKIDRNVQRDKEVNLALRKMGVKVIRVTDRDVNRRPKWVMSKIRRSYGQLIRNAEHEARIVALREFLSAGKEKPQKQSK